MENAGRLPAVIYRECTIYTILSPCSMCSGAIALYEIPKVIIGENTTFTGEEDWLRSKGIIVDVVNDEECIGMMAQFIKEHPELWNEDIGI